MINTIFNEDALATMQRMPDNYIPLTVTSPPYDNLRTYKGFSFEFEKIAAELYRITAMGGVVVWVVGDAVISGSESGTSFRQALYFMGLGFKLHDTMIYAKKNFIPLTHNRYEQAFEFMLVFSKGKPKTFNGITEESKTANKSKNYKCAGNNVREGGYRRRNETVITKDSKLHSNIFYYATGGGKAMHPAPFPEQLATDQIHTWSREGDTVYDPFAGSGTTPKMAVLLKRNYIASEIAEEYCAIIKQRTEDAEIQMML